MSTSADPEPSEAARSSLVGPTRIVSSRVKSLLQKLDHDDEDPQEEEEVVEVQVETTSRPMMTIEPTTTTNDREDHPTAPVMVSPLPVEPDDSFSDGMVVVMQQVEDDDDDAKEESNFVDETQAMTEDAQPEEETRDATETTGPEEMVTTAPPDDEKEKMDESAQDEEPTVPVAAPKQRFCKVQEIGDYDPPQYILLPFSEFSPSEEEQEASLDSLADAVTNALSLTEPFSLSYVDAAGDLIGLSSDEGLRQALERVPGDVKIRVRPTRVPTAVESFVVELTATWKNNLRTRFESHRLMESDETSYSKLQEIASHQFEVPIAGLVFRLPQWSSNQRVQRIATNEDLAEACQTLTAGDVLVLDVELALCTSIRVDYPTIDNDTLSRRIPIQSILSEDDGTVSYEKLLVTVAESLGTEEFVLMYSTQEKVEGEQKENKFFISGIADLMDALRLFRSSELVLVPQVPGQDDDALANPIALVQTESSIGVQVKEEEQPASAPLSPIIQLTFQGRDDAIVEYPLGQILVGDEKEQKASYWKLVGIVSEAFYLGAAPRICIFYVGSDGTKAEIKSDTYLSEIIAGLSSPFLPSKSQDQQEPQRLRIRVEPIVFSLTTASSGIMVRNFALSHVLYNDRSTLSFGKLVRLARMIDPVIGLTYLNLAGVTKVIRKDADLVEALQLYPRGDLLIRPHTQQNPYVIDVKQANLSGQKCKLGSWSIPNIMFKTDSGVSLWDLSQLVPGKYRFSTRYWRDLNHGDVNLSIGVIKAKEGKHVLAYLEEKRRLRQNALGKVSLPATGLNETDFSQVTALGEFSVRSSVTAGSTTAFLVVAASQEWKGSPEVFISDMECFYVGPLE